MWKEADRSVHWMMLVVDKKVRVGWMSHLPITLGGPLTWYQCP